MPGSAAANFLREVVGTREYPELEALLSEAGWNSNLAGKKRKARDGMGDKEGENVQLPNERKLGVGIGPMLLI